MNVWITICRKQSRCNWCPEPIEKTAYKVVTSYYRGRWLVKKNYHTECWVNQGIEAVSKRGIIESRGMQRMEITDESRIMRVSILRRRASVIQRIKRATTKNDNVKEMIHLGSLLHKLKEEIEPHGGIPDSW